MLSLFIIPCGPLKGIGNLDDNINRLGTGGNINGVGRKYGRGKINTGGSK